MLRIKENRKKAKFKFVPTCPLCNKQGSTLKIKNFCICITKDSDFEIVEINLDGKIVKNRIIKKENYDALKLTYMKELYKLKHPEKTEQEIPFTRPRKKRKNDNVSRTMKNEFYQSWEWKNVRYKMLKKYGPKCMLCGCTNDEGRICVDHIIPLGEDWNKRLDPLNLQILCNDCNMGKSNRDKTDFRKQI